MTRSSRRGPWLPEEDHSLMELVRTQGPNNWVRISQQLQHRSPKQCRERYHQNLKPTLNHEPISAQEGELIEQMVHEMGKRWAEIARRLGNRSDNAVKNWWNGSMNRRKRNPSQQNGLKHVGNRLHPIPMTRSDRSPFVDLPPLPHYLHQHPHHTNRDHMSNWPYQPGTDNYESRPVSLHGYEHHSTGSFSNTGPSHLAQSAPPDLISLRLRPDFSTSHSRESSSYDTRAELPPLRLPLPNNSSGWQSPHFNHSERALVSPAISDVSQAPSIKQEPSLISDNQSTYSISPRTVTSPRSSLPVPIDTSGRSWNLANSARSNEPASSRFSIAGSGLNIDEGYSSAMSTSTVPDQKCSYTPLDPNLRGSRSPLDTLLHQGLEKNDSTKDTRMHLSSLLD